MDEEGCDKIRERGEWLDLSIPCHLVHSWLHVLPRRQH